jgi:pimeloyl-ACP methyl ester carboxylesterase
VERAARDQVPGADPRGRDDPICPLPVVEDLARQLPAGTTRLVRMPKAGHNIFRDRPDLAFPAVEEFIRHVQD